MTKSRQTTMNPNQTITQPAQNAEDEEFEMIGLAIGLAKQQLRDGTASSQVITHFLKLGSTRERLEKEMMEKQKELITAKAEAIKSAKRVEELYSDALAAMRRYSGQDREEIPDDEYDQDIR